VIPRPKLPPLPKVRPRIREGQTIHRAYGTFSNCPAFRGDQVIAVEDERADGGVLCAGFDATTGAPWAGILFVDANAPTIHLGEPDEHTPAGELPEAVEENKSGFEHSPADGEKGEEAPTKEGEDEQEAKAGEGEGGGLGQEEDELLALIHGIAGGRDQVVMQEMAGAMMERLAGDVHTKMSDLQDMVFAKLEEIREQGLTERTIIEVKGLPPIKLDADELVHNQLEYVLGLIAAGAKNVMIVGPAGCGKTTLARQVAKVLGHERFAALSCSPGMSEAKVLGRIGAPTPTNPTGYHQTAIIAAFRDEGTILFDEMDNADASMMVSFNAMTDGGFATLPTGETVPRHPGNVILAAMNTFGHGADRLYVGRNQLDAATLDRFVGATIEMDYDRALERKLCPETPVRQAVWGLRDKARKHGLRRVVSTRSLVAARRLHLALGQPMELVLQNLTLGWSAQDRATVGVTA